LWSFDSSQFLFLCSVDWIKHYGEPVDGARPKRELIESRVGVTRRLFTEINKLDSANRPSSFIQASGVDFSPTLYEASFDSGFG